MCKYTTDYVEADLANYDRAVAEYEKVKELSADYVEADLANYDRAVAEYEKVKELSADYVEADLANYDRAVAEYGRVRELSADYVEADLAIYDRAVAEYEKVRELSADYVEAYHANYNRILTTSDKVKEFKGNCVETYYNRDLAYRGKEEPNHAIGDYNGTIEPNLELEQKSIFGDGLAFPAGNKEISSNTTINVRINIGQIIQGEKIEMKSEISNSQVGVLNTGEMQAKSITASVSTPVDPSQHQITEALKSLTESVKASQDISSQQRAEILEQLEVLSTQATLAPSEWKAGLIKPILLALSTALSAGGGLAEIWSTWGNMIESFFDVHG